MERKNIMKKNISIAIISIIIASLILSVTFASELIKISDIGILSDASVLSDDEVSESGIDTQDNENDSKVKTEILDIPDVSVSYSAELQEISQFW